MSMIHIAATSSNSSLTNVQSGDVQPNAVDLRLDRVFHFVMPDSMSMFELSEEGKSHREVEEMYPDSDGWFYFDKGQYEILMENEVSVGEGEAGWVITRSSLTRNGLFIASGLYDSGYSGVMAAVLHCNGPARIKQGTRVGQFLLFESQSVGMYDGSYGSGKASDINRYGVE